jgi:glycosyltransferase involved in cell wall biosynthesis
MTLDHLALGIPVYNQEATIAQTLASALAQTEPFDEIVVVENHSTDGTAERLQAFAGKIRIISPPSHLGVADNWNYCVGQMNADWFSLLSGDDLLKPDFSSGIRKAISDNSSAVLIRTDWDVIDGDGAVLSVHRQLSVSRITSPPKTWQEQLQGPKVSFAAFAARRDLWQSVGGFPADFHLLLDWMFWLKLAPFGSFVRVPTSLAQYRIQDRPEIDRKRVRLRLLDEYHYLMDILPSLPWRGASGDRKIIAVRQRRLTDLLNYLALYPTEINTDECLSRLEALAKASRMTKIYEAWLVNHEPIVPPLSERLLLRLKSLIRRSRA